MNKSNILKFYDPIKHPKIGANTIEIIIGVNYDPA
jgi:hypothetical protein